MLYIFCFSLSGLFSYIDFKCKNRKAIIAVLMAVISVFIPCFLAGARDVNIGTDVKTYVTLIFDYIIDVNPTFSEFFSINWFVESLGYGFMALAYIVTRFTDNIFWFMFLIEFLCIIPVYVALRKCDLTPALKSFSLIIFYLSFYGHHLNIMRQSIAMSIVFCGYYFLKEKKYTRYLLLCLICSLFIHETAVLGIVSFILYYACVNYNKLEITLGKRKKILIKNDTSKLSNKQYIIILILISMQILAFIFLRKIIIIVAQFKSTYIYQVRHMGAYNVGIYNLIFYILLFIPLVLYYPYLTKKDSIYRFYFFNLVVAFIFSMFSGVSIQLSRLQLYQYMYISIYIPKAISEIKSFKGRFIFCTYYTFLFILNWVYFFCISGYGEIYPYTSQLLGIEK